jgi:hypothetical protein
MKNKTPLFTDIIACLCLYHTSAGIFLGSRALSSSLTMEHNISEGSVSSNTTVRGVFRLGAVSGCRHKDKVTLSLLGLY